MSNIIVEAQQYAQAAHKGVKRDWGDDDYIEHPTRVARRTGAHDIASKTTVCAAWLHDVPEDTEKTDADIRAAFGHPIADLVKELTNPSKGMKLGRAKRKQIDRDHLATVSREAQVIKLLDRIDNIKDLGQAPDDFKKLYAHESRLLADVIGHADLELKAELLEAIKKLEETTAK